MGKAFSGLFLLICITIFVSLVKIIVITPGEDDCMISYVMSEQKHGYMYEIEDKRYHIDTNIYPGLKQIGVSKGCLMIPFDKKLTFMAFSNTMYCSVISAFNG